MRPNGLPAAVTITATILATLAGCGEEAPAGRVSVLTAQETKSTAPDGKAMPDWNVTNAPHVTSMTSQLGKAACEGGAKPTCTGARYMGTSTFKRSDQAQIVFWVTAFTSEAAAKAAYGANRSWYSRSIAEPKNIDLGSLGDRRDGVQGGVGYEKGDQVGAYAQVRGGTCIAAFTVHESGAGPIDDELVKDLATMLTKRVRQAQNGDRPSAKLES
ncbi:hypothetical protein [Streptomyces sp. V4I2]|uniref:hypothetical protein n=1 Tax=Streptomyces sp. V4I2 TaxID=3042280 RepID=UPI002782FC5E|nr:hypothetical protein [Streptomyces sp. V4I2]MDQ1049011.1 hypothetical protein [Streptomyces sp. V4I2]